MKFKNIILSLLMVCSISTSTVFADSNMQPLNISPSSNIVPFSLYYREGFLDVWKTNNAIRVNIATKAFSAVDHIYHEVTIHKNNSLYWYETYENWDIQYLETNITVPATIGDIVNVEVNHYVSHNGAVEQGYSYDGKIY